MQKEKGGRTSHEKAQKMQKEKGGRLATKRHKKCKKEKGGRASHEKAQKTQKKEDEDEAGIGWMACLRSAQLFFVRLVPFCG